MVALTLSVLALSGGIAAGEPTTPAPDLFGAIPSFACETPVSTSEILVLALSASQLRTGAEEPSWIKDISLSMREEPMRESMDLGSPIGLAEAPAPIELTLAAPTKYFDVSLAQRTQSSEFRGASISGQGAEVRIGRGLSLLQSGGGGPQQTGWYLFAASDGRQLSWTPTSDPATPTRSLRLDNGVEIGELQIGLAAQHGALQSSLSLVKRTVKSYAGPFRSSADGSFAGITLAYKN